MLELIDSKPNKNVPEREYIRLLGFPPGFELNGRSRELADWARQWYEENGRPWMYIREARAFDISDGFVTIEENPFSSSRFHRQLSEAEAEGAMLVAISAGRELEGKTRQLWNEEKPDEYFFLEMYGSAVAEHLVALAAYRLCEWADPLQKAILPHYSPGYPGWSISEQKRLFHIILDGKSGNLPGDLNVFESGMLTPKKSLLAVFGVTSRLEKARHLAEFIPCHTCSLTRCQYRRAPYRFSIPQLEEVRTLQPARNASTDHNPLAHTEQRYTFNIEAIKKWSRERLDLRTDTDGTIEAKFRYEGTTCSNLGRPLEFDYFVRVNLTKEGYWILDTRCHPAPGDIGHTYMCQYIENAEPLMRAIENEKPFVGKPLSEIFDWKRPYNPSACYCTAESREHKWGLVLEVLHYALTNGNPNDRS